MSVLSAKRKESRFEPIIFSETLHDMLLELMHKNFGIKDVDEFVRIQYAHGRIKEEDFAYYRWQLKVRKDNIEQYASRLSANLRDAYYRYPTTMHEYEIRRDRQNDAIVNCEMIVKELQRTVDMFEVDINLFREHIKAINREIELIKKWRQRDNKIKSYLQRASSD